MLLWCSDFGKIFIKPLRKITKMTNYGLLHIFLIKLVFFEIVVKLRKHVHSSNFNSANSMLNFLFESFDFVISC